jgi:hypothetical protein
MKKLFLSLMIGLVSMTSIFANPFKDKVDLTKWETYGDSKVEVSKEHVTKGENSAKVIFGDGKYPGIGLIKCFRKTRLNLSTLKSLSVDIYNPGGPVKLFLLLKSKGVKVQKGYSISTGNYVLNLKLADVLEKIDIKKIYYIKFYIYKPLPGTVLYFNNFQLEEEPSAIKAE